MTQLQISIFFRLLIQLFILSFKINENIAFVLYDPRVYNYYFYINTNPDLREAGLFSKQDAKSHWLTYGIKEGRQGCGSFHSLQYLDNYPSLKQKFGTNYTEAIEYYLRYGYSAGQLGYTIGGGYGRYVLSTLTQAGGKSSNSNMNSTIFISGSDRSALSIDSLIWNNIEFINAWDHGREIQQAVFLSFDQYSVCYNPNEAGSGDSGDYIGYTSSSILLNVKCDNYTLKTSTLPAYWMTPGTTDSLCGTAVNKDIVSNWTMNKVIKFHGKDDNSSNYNYNYSYSYDDDDINIIYFNGSVYVPINVSTIENSNGIQMDSPAVYFNSNFDTFYTIAFNSNSDINSYGNLNKVSIAKEGVYPVYDDNTYVIISQNDSLAALGIIAKEKPGHGYVMFNYLGLEYDCDKTTKYTVATLHENVPMGTTIYYQNWFCIGTLEMVRKCMTNVFVNEIQ